MKEKVILGVAFEKNWRKIRANVTLQKIIGENRDNFELIRRNVQGKSPSRRAGGTAGRGARQACRGAGGGAVVANNTGRDRALARYTRARGPPSHNVHTNEMTSLMVHVAGIYHDRPFKRNSSETFWRPKV